MKEVQLLTLCCRLKNSAFQHRVGSDYDNMETEQDAC